MKRTSKISLLLCFSLLFLPLALLSSEFKFLTERQFLQDSTEKEILDSVVVAKINTLNSLNLTVDSIDLNAIKKNPYLGVGDFLVGQSPGVLVQRPSAEPGTYQNIIVRGLGSPQLSNRDAVNNMAAVYVNGIPIAQEHPFSSSLQRYDLARLGPATDYLSSIDLSTIASIEVIKDPVRLAELGPLAANGAIWITTYGGVSSERLIGVNSYIGVATKPVVTPVNADYENRFRRQFYDKYRTTNDDQELRYPGYLADQTNPNYYGAADWMDRYYSNALLYNVDMNIRGGSDRANFAFYGGHVQNAVSSDDAKFRRYNAMFNVNMLPFEWITLSTFINARKTSRERNRDLRERFAEMAYLPDLSTPISPNKNMYGQYLDQYKRNVVDDNITNNLQGNIKVDVNIMQGLTFSTNFMLDYNEGRRDLFYPKTLMETINYQSGYFGFSQRFIFSNKLGYDFNLAEDNKIHLGVGTDYQEDLYRYYFARAYDGPNDYIKLNVVEGSQSESDYLLPQGGLRVLRWNNKEQFHMQSFYGSVNYTYKDLFDINGVLRWDGASTIQRDNRWLLTPALSATWHLGQTLESEEPFSLRASYARVALPNYDSRFAMGPQYNNTSLGWDEEPAISSYFGYVGITRNYDRGWVGYNLDWAYSDKIEVALDKSFLNSRLSTNLAFYQTNDKNQIINIPVPGEYGYSSEFVNGLEVKNMGVDAIISGDIFERSADKFGWTSSLNVNFNKNELVGLPNNLKQLIVGDRLLKVGEAIDSYWLYQNQGIYTDASSIPQQNGERLTLDGVDFEVGDAIWKDNNGDNIINSDDKVIKGRSTPKVFGGFNNTLTYKGFQMDLSFHYALGNHVLNQRAANRYDFINNESSNSINAVREIFQWQQDVDIQNYPIYNVWSNTNPYRIDQDLFLEDVSFIKLRSVTFGYDLANLSSFKNRVNTLRRAYLYLNANNIFTIASFSGNDPELVNFNGYYDGYGMPLTKSFTLGIKLDL